MRVVDTSAWIEWLVDSPAAAALAPLMPVEEDWLLPTMVQLELAKWVMRTMPEEAEAERRILALTRSCTVIDLDAATATLAAEVCRRKGLATADAVIYATALLAGADLLTCDAHFRGLPGVLHVAKG